MKAIKKGVGFENDENNELEIINEINISTLLYLIEVKISKPIIVSSFLNL